MTENQLLRDARRLRCRRYVVSRGAQPDPAMQHANASPAPVATPLRTRTALPSYEEWLGRFQGIHQSRSFANAGVAPATESQAEEECGGIAAIQAQAAIAVRRPAVVGCAPSRRRTAPRPISRGADSLFPSIANPLSGQLSSMPHAAFDLDLDLGAQGH